MDSAYVISMAEAFIKGDTDRATMLIQALEANARSAKHGRIADQLEALRKLIKEQPNQMALGFDQEAMKFASPQVPMRTLDQIVLNPDVEIEIKRIIEEYEQREQLKAFNLVPTNRLLLSGATGTGKTSLAEAMANKLELPFVRVGYESMIDSYLGQSAANLHSVFKGVQHRSCVLFFDEFDTVASTRAPDNGRSDVGEMRRLVNILIMLMDMLPSHVFLVAATNQLDLLDTAIVRRFNRVLDVPKPTEDTLQRWVVQYNAQFNQVLSDEMCNRIVRNSETIAHAEQAFLASARDVALGRNDKPQLVTAEDVRKTAEEINDLFYPSGVNVQYNAIYNMDRTKEGHSYEEIDAFFDKLDSIASEEGMYSLFYSKTEHEVVNVLPKIVKVLKKAKRDNVFTSHNEVDLSLNQLIVQLEGMIATPVYRLANIAMSMFAWHGIEKPLVIEFFEDVLTGKEAKATQTVKEIDLEYQEYEDDIVNLIRESIEWIKHHPKFVAQHGELE